MCYMSCVCTVYMIIIEMDMPMSPVSNIWCIQIYVIASWITVLAFMVSDEEIKGILHPNILALITYKVTLHLCLPRFGVKLRTFTDILPRFVV